MKSPATITSFKQQLGAEFALGIGEKSAIKRQGVDGIRNPMAGLFGPQIMLWELVKTTL